MSRPVDDAISKKKIRTYTEPASPLKENHEEAVLDQGKKRIATESEKRQFLEEQILGDFLKGGHALSEYLRRRVLVHMDEEDKQCLLDRLMKIPEDKKIMLYYTLNSLVTRELLNLEPIVINQIDIIKDQLALTKDQIALRDYKNTPTVMIKFKHITPPSTKEGGWACKDEQHPSMKEWYRLYSEYEEFIGQGSGNAVNIRQIWENNMPLDCAITRSTLGKRPLMRFIIFEPYPESQKGFNMYIVPHK